MDVAQLARLVQQGREAIVVAPQTPVENRQLGARARNDVLANSGWTQNGTVRWRNTMREAIEMAKPPQGGVARRITRDADTGKLVEDLWIGRATSKRLIGRQLRSVKNIVVDIELDAVDEDEIVAWEDQPMTPAEQTRYRGTAARVNFLAVDRPDLQYASKETARQMANPTNGDWEMLKRIARYLVSHKRFVHVYEWQDASPTVSIYSDSNWAGCLRTRKSTFGACLFNGRHLVRYFAKTKTPSRYPAPSLNSMLVSWPPPRPWA